MTDNANEAAKMKPRVAVVSDGQFEIGGSLKPLFFFSDAAADVEGLG